MGIFRSALILLALAAAAVAGTIYLGLLDPGADEPHSEWVHALIETTRDRAIAVRADDLSIPSLGSEAQVRSGAGNYDAMCASCHLAPGMAATELSQGLYPAPPALAKSGAPDPARAFWVIKHGVKASGMPAWGGHMPDEYIWNMVAFLRELPAMDAGQYQALVAASGGHSHGGGETMPHAGHGGAGHSDHPAPAGAGHHEADAGEPGHHDAGSAAEDGAADEHDHSTHDH